MSEIEHDSTAKAEAEGHWLAAWVRDFPGEFARCWTLLPTKGLFFTALVAWLALFHFLGNSTFGYVDTASLMGWMRKVYYNANSDGEDEHGMWIPLVVLALFWWKRKKLIEVQTRLWWPGLMLLALCLLLHVAGYLVQQPRISIVALFGGIYALMGLAWGPRWLAASFFPFFLFVFCVPISSIAQPVTVPLRIMVTQISASLAHVIGINVLREGTQIFDAQHTYRYEVAAACSGIHSLVAIFALSTVYAFVNFERHWKRLLMMAAAFPLAILGNVIRMMAIIIAAEMGGQTSGNFVHENWFFSLLPYAPAIWGVILLGDWLGRARREPATPLRPKTA